MDGDAQTDGTGGPTGESPIGRWVTMDRGDAYVHVFVGPRGLIARGPDSLLGVPYAWLASLDGQVTIHPKGDRPAGYDAHPHYRQMRAADLPHRTPDDAAAGLEQALAAAPIPPWVRQMRRELIAHARTALQKGEVELALSVNGAVAAPLIAAGRQQAAALPAVYRAVWHAAGYQCVIVGRKATGLPDVVERERTRGTLGIFIPNRETAYIFAQHTATDYDLRATILEEVAHGLDLLIGVLHGYEGVHPGRLPIETTARSNQPDLLAIWSKATTNARIDRYYRRVARELFAWAFISAQYAPDILEREHPRLFRFMVDLEREVAAHVGL